MYLMYVRLRKALEKILTHGPYLGNGPGCFLVPRTLDLGGPFEMPFSGAQTLSSAKVRPRGH